jgi:hypothetical protein
MTEKKTRNIFFTGWIVVLLVVYAGSALTNYVMSKETVLGALPPLPGWTFPVLILISIFEIIFATALYFWKEWGFWGLCFAAVGNLIVNLTLGSMGFGFWPFLFRLFGILVLFGVMQIGREQKIWTQLE